MSVQKPETQPIIIKKKVVHSGHHGGAWKVAYADFVTALMSLFIVLWLMNSTPQVKKAVAGYFQDPSGKGNLQGSAQAGAGESLDISRMDMSKLKEKLEASMKEAPDLAKLKDQVQMTVTGEGLRIELLETDVGTFFQTGSAQPSSQGTEMLEMLAGELGKLPNRLLIEGHTDARPFTMRASYSNWELSADRANAARKLMQTDGLRGNQVAEVRGFADQCLRKPNDPDDPSNRRVSIIVKYVDQTAPQAAPTTQAAKKTAPGGPESKKTEPNKAEAKKAEPNNTGPKKPEPAKAEPKKPEPAKAASARSEPAKPEPQANSQQRPSALKPAPKPAPPAPAPAKRAG